MGMQAVEGLLDIDRAGHLDGASAGEPGEGAIHGFVSAAVSRRAKASSLVGAEGVQLDRRPVAGSCSDSAAVAPARSGGTGCRGRDRLPLGSRARPRSVPRRKPLVPGSMTMTSAPVAASRATMAPSARSSKRSDAFQRRRGSGSAGAADQAEQVGDGKGEDQQAEPDEQRGPRDGSDWIARLHAPLPSLRPLAAAAGRHCRAWRQPGPSPAPGPRPRRPRRGPGSAPRRRRRRCRASVGCGRSRCQGRACGQKKSKRYGAASAARAADIAGAVRMQLRRGRGDQRVRQVHRHRQRNAEAHDDAAVGDGVGRGPRHAPGEDQSDADHQQRRDDEMQRIQRGDGAARRRPSAPRRCGPTRARRNRRPGPADAGRGGRRPAGPAGPARGSSPPPAAFPAGPGPARNRVP